MEKQRTTFLSYSRANKDFALKLAKELKAEGFDIWLDQLDIPTGSRWDDEVERALEKCNIFMVILTPASSTSDNVKDEIGYAVDAKKRILPILLENATLPLRLRRFQYVDFTSKSYDEGVASAKELLRDLIQQDPLSGPPHNLSTELPVGSEFEAVKAKPVPGKHAEREREPKQAIQKKRVSKGVVYSIGALIILVLFGIGSNAFFNSKIPTAATKLANKAIDTQVSTSTNSSAEVPADNDSVDTNSRATIAAESSANIECGSQPTTGQINGLNVTRVEYSGSAPFQAFVQGQSGIWFEVAVDKTYSDIPYKEVARDQWSVYLHDNERNYDIQLDLYTREVREDFNDGNGGKKRNTIEKSYNGETGYAVCLVRYNGGEFVQTSDQSWMEKSSNNAEYQYTELHRDEWSVYLFDQSRNYKIRIDLYNRLIYLDENNGKGEFAVHEILSSENQSQQK